ncbi:MAG TPA: DASS family sodium-coupled anion symporter, partial [Alphaproteobacteria bacterium]|nr:DASS family sodium-coupled anion symporter [Alphaproteobacteria bacterium]
LESLPSSAIGLIGVTTVAALAPWTLFGPAELSAPGFNAPARAIEWALSGFSNSTVWLAFSAFMFGTAYDRTGLGRRIALSLVKVMGGRTLFLGYAVMLSDVILAPFTPSNTARSAGMIFPIIRSLPPLYDSRPNDPSARKIGAYILWTGFATSCVTSSLFLPALAPNLLAIDFIRKAGHIEITWLKWFLAFAPAGIPLLVALPLLVYVLYPPGLKQSREAPAWAGQELAKLGSLSARESAVGLLALTAILLWIFGGQFINATTVALVVVSIMLLTGVITWDDTISNREAWKALTLLATLVTLSDGLYRTGLVGWFATMAVGAMSGLSPNLTIVGLIGVYFLSHYLFASLTAHATAMLPILLSLGLGMPGIPFEKLALLLGLTQGIMGVLTPYATGPAPVYANSGYITPAEYWRLGTIFGIIFLGALLLLSAPVVLWME